VRYNNKKFLEGGGIIKRTYVTTLPDHVGTFLKASRCMAKNGLNITRVSYNKAVDVHTLFIEAQGSAEAHISAEEELRSYGYILDQYAAGQVMLMEFRLKDVPGAVIEILELISKFNFNISYISSKENGTGYQNFRMGLFVEKTEDVSEFIYRASRICSVRILNYEMSEKNIDNSIFYISFANEIADKLGLGQTEKAKLVVNANKIMQILDDMQGSPQKTFKYIGLFADYIHRCKGTGFNARVSRYATAAGMDILHIEPPCGSNTAILNCNGKLLFIDCGFGCYKQEMQELIAGEYSKEMLQGKALLLTHPDADHCGLVNIFEKTYASAKCAAGLMGDDPREHNPLHAPYVRISKLLSGYDAPEANKIEIIGQAPEENIGGNMVRIGNFAYGDADFEIYEGNGGHVKGECVFIERKHRIVFTGDIFVNIAGFTPEQKEFNRLAPYLMTSVDTDPKAAASERAEIFDLLDKGEWMLFCGHGAMKIYNKE